MVVKYYSSFINLMQYISFLNEATILFGFFFHEQNTLNCSALVKSCNMHTVIQGCQIKKAAGVETCFYYPNTSS